MEPTSGSIRIGEETLFSSSDRVSVAPHLRRIGFVFQDLALWPHLRALDQVRLVASAAGESDGSARAKAAESLSAVGLGGLERRRPAELSPRIPGPTFYVTHDPGDVWELAEDILELENGQLVPRASPEELDF